MFLAKSVSALRDPHKLMCLYLQTMGFDEVPDGDMMQLRKPKIDAVEV